MIKVHHLNNSRSHRVLWCMEELGVEYQIVPYQRDAKTMLAPPELQSVHPLGKSPVISDGEQVVAESGAILEYLAERYGDGQFAPALGAHEFQSFRYWMHYAEGSLMPQLLLKLYLGRVGEAGKSALQRIDSQIQTHLKFIEHSFRAPYLLGEDLTIADIQLSFPVEVMATQSLLTEGQPRTRDWLRRLHQRPAYQRALQAGGTYAYAKD
jgi:glutathione S-transferase